MASTLPGASCIAPAHCGIDQLHWRCTMKLHRSVKVVLAAALSAAQPCLADAVLDWNEVAIGTVLAARRSPPDDARNMAMVHVAMFDAINAVQPHYKPYAFK